MSRPKAFITGITGMDSSHLAEQLLEREYDVYGLIRRSSTDNTWRIRNIMDRIELVTGDMTDATSLSRAISAIQPDEIYNLAAQSYVGASWKAPESTFDVNATGLIRLLEAVRNFGKKGTRIYQASSSEMFGKVKETPQVEKTPFYPRSVYGCSKAAAHYIAVNYRESYNMFISCGIAFNHCSHRRGLEFLVRKVSHGVAKIYLGKATHISLGNMDAKRDWSWAPEVTQAMWRMLQLNKPADLVLSSGQTHSVREFVQATFEAAEILDWKSHIKQNPKYMRPAEVDLLQGNSRLAKSEIDWDPKVGFKDIVSRMLHSDVERLKRGDQF